MTGGFVTLLFLNEYVIEKKITNLENRIYSNCDFSLQTSSTGTRSRSATPDSLDSEEENTTTTDWSGSRELLTVTGNRHQKCLTDTSPAVLPSHELFARAGHHWSVHRIDVASDSEGIELLGYQRFGTISGPPHWAVRTRSGSVPTVTVSALDLQTPSSVPNNVPLMRCERNPNSVSFESSFFETKHTDRKNSQTSTDALNSQSSDDSLHEMLHVTDAESSMLRPLLWLELSSIFDKHVVAIKKRVPYKRKRKENGNVFGVSLSSLVMRDRRICIDNSTVPQVFQMILGQLEARCCKEEGILRIAGQKQRVETLYTQVENNFYTKPEEIQESLIKTTCHELTSILKRLLRELPQPLLTTELIDLFYTIHLLPNWETQCKAMNLLVLLLPIEHSGTLRIVISFLKKVIENEIHNKMSLHNVAMIIAPSLFPPTYMQLHSGKDNADISGQVKIAAVCCHLVEILLQCGLDLWKIPPGLWAQLQTAKKMHKPIRNKELHRSNTHYDSSGASRAALKEFHLT